jgi:hypothetical protein
MTQQAMRSPVDTDIQDGKMEISFCVHSGLDAVHFTSSQRSTAASLILGDR